VSYLQRKLEAFQAKSLLFRTLVVTSAFLAGSTLFVGGISYAAVSAVQGVFHNPEPAASGEPNSGAADREGLAAGAGTVREKAPATPSSARKVARAPGTTAKRSGERPARGDTPE
jgi:hypothetical protein